MKVKPFTSSKMMIKGTPIKLTFHPSARKPPRSLPRMNIWMTKRTKCVDRTLNRHLIPADRWLMESIKTQKKMLWMTWRAEGSKVNSAIVTRPLQIVTKYQLRAKITSSRPKTSADWKHMDARADHRRASKIWTRLTSRIDKRWYLAPIMCRPRGCNT